MRIRENSSPTLRASPRNQVFNQRTFPTSTGSDESEERKERPGMLTWLTVTQMFKECQRFTAVGKRFEDILKHPLHTLLLPVVADNDEYSCVAVEYSRANGEIQVGIMNRVRCIF